jgi:hypothetical protein
LEGREMKKLVTICAVACLIMAMNGAAGAAIIGGFNGGLDGWEKEAESVSTKTIATLGSYTVTPTEGTGFLLFTGYGGIYKFGQEIGVGDVLSFDYVATFNFSCAAFTESDFVTGAFNEDTNGQWKHGSLDLSIFAGGTAAIEFLGNNAALDNVRLGAVPEPATMLLLGIGGLLLRRKK